ncbi:MAG: PssE/Cps14G family polysaccharide biosynthesis glycosyltransferase [Candidatus Diapherotrites archaeon]
MPRTKPAGGAPRGGRRDERPAFGGEIFVTVGTHTQQFDRLLREVDGLVAGGKIKARVFAQTGNSKYVPKNYGWKKFLDAREYEEAIRASSLVISHGGAGAIISALRAGKRLIIVPRLKEFGEHTDSHQTDLARAMQERGKALAAFSIGELEGKIKACTKLPTCRSERKKVVECLERFALALEGKGKNE